MIRIQQAPKGSRFGHMTRTPRCRIVGEEMTLEDAIRAAIRTETAAVVRTEFAAVLDELRALTREPQSPTWAPWMSVKDAAAYADVKRGTVRAWIKRKRLAATKAGGGYRVRREDVDRLLSGDVSDSAEATNDGETERADEIVARATPGSRTKE